MAELTTRPTTSSVTGFLSGVDQPRRKDCAALVKLMKQATGARTS